MLNASTMLCSGSAASSPAANLRNIFTESALAACSSAMGSYSSTYWRPGPPLGRNQRSLVGKPNLLFRAGSVEPAMGFIPQKGPGDPLE
ncbi:hypothetical protein D3C72_2408890 [compost metagenome]